MRKSTKRKKAPPVQTITEEEAAVWRQERGISEPDSYAHFRLRPRCAATWMRWQLV